MIPAETSDTPSPPNAMLWRISPTRSRRTLPAGFIRPCQPFPVARPAGADWLHEVRRDGYRLLGRKQGERVSLWTRHGKKFTERLPMVRRITIQGRSICPWERRS